MLFKGLAEIHQDVFARREARERLTDECLFTLRLDAEARGLQTHVSVLAQNILGQPAVVTSRA